jgi:predicted GIY-YIG superfamily endonuclease
MKNGNYYTGFSADLKSRVNSHQNGEVSQTKSFLPVELVFYAGFNDKLKALQFETYLKSSSGFAFRNKHFV